MNNLDKTSKTLLFFLVTGVWGLLVRLFFLPTMVQAQPPAPPQKTKQTALSVAGDYLYLYQDGRLYVYGFEGAVKHKKELIAKGFASPTGPDETKPGLLSTYDLVLPGGTK